MESEPLQRQIRRKHTVPFLNKCFVPSCVLVKVLQLDSVSSAHNEALQRPVLVLQDFLMCIVFSFMSISSSKFTDNPVMFVSKTNFYYSRMMNIKCVSSVNMDTFLCVSYFSYMTDTAQAQLGTNENTEYNIMNSDCPKFNDIIITDTFNVLPYLDCILLILLQLTEL